MYIPLFRFVSSSFDLHSKEAARLRDEAESLPHGLERVSLLREAQQADAAAHVEKWMSSPGLQRPT